MCKYSQPPLDITNFEFNLCKLLSLIDGGNGSNPRKPPRCDQKAAKNCFRYDCSSHSLPLGFEPATIALNAE